MFLLENWIQGFHPLLVAPIPIIYPTEENGIFTSNERISVLRHRHRQGGGLLLQQVPLQVVVRRVPKKTTFPPSLRGRHQRTKRMMTRRNREILSVFLPTSRPGWEAKTSNSSSRNRSQVLLRTGARCPILAHLYLFRPQHLLCNEGRNQARSLQARPHKKEVRAGVVGAVP